ncbi:hypothetical protein Tco_1094013 [Tanacetum coccineum]|uniref:Retrotransposon Copia-like N-terminal domain-containing protein n=1 Tax=Tanacetum coccineum TaxID=301880 RepID=A0ABQ5IEC1_9ASTR
MANSTVNPNLQQNSNQNSNQDPNSQNMMNDPLHLASSTKMALGTKLKLRFIDGSLPKLTVIHNDYQRWVRCDYMVTCWILNSMVAELSESFLYAQSASDLWKELEEQYGQINGPLIYHIDSRSKLMQFLMRLNDDFEAVRNQILTMDPLPNINKAYYIVQQVEKQKQVTHQVADPIAFFANNKGNQNVKRDNMNDGKS